MTYTRNNWKNQTDPTFDPEVDPPISAANLNNIEQGIVDAHTHIDASNNPHTVTKSQVGLGNVTNDAQLTSSQLETTITDDDAKVPSSGAVVDYVAGHADMLKSSYDSNADGKVNSADAADAVPWTGVSGKPSTYPPDSHNHDSAYSAIGHAHTGTYEPAFSKNTAFNKNFGTGVGEVCQGNDSRLSDARTPSSHGNEAHSSTFITASDVHSNANDPTASEKAAFAGTSGTPSDSNRFVTNADSRMTDARTPASHTHGNITNDGKIGTTATLPIITTTGGVLAAGSFGTDAGTFCQGNDSRLSDNRTDANAIHGNASSELSALTEKTTLADNDVILIEDSAATYAKKKALASVFSQARNGGKHVFVQSTEPTALAVGDIWVVTS